ncbi:MAG: redoxin domain-containing protein [Thermodesulfobacteriota bacterium]
MKHFLGIILAAILFVPGVSGAKDDLWQEFGLTRIGPASAPDFILEDINGKKVSLKDLKGKLVALNFWATWCPPCKEEMPSFSKLDSMLGKKGLSVVAINDYENKKKAVNFAKKNNYKFIVLIDESGKVSESYKASFLPTTFIIDQNGMAIGKAVGARDWASPVAIKIFEELLKK